MAMERATKLLEEYAGAEIQTGTVIYDESDKSDRVIDITAKNINDVLGANISEEEIIEVYRKLGFLTKKNGEVITVTVPRRRLDISIKEDLIEEVSRIYGVDNIEGKLPNGSMKIGTANKIEREIRNKMISLGLNDTLPYILINDKDVHKFTNDKFEELKLLDPMTEERNTLRYSLIPSLYKLYEFNKAHYNKNVNIFEIGKGFWKKNEKYGEDLKLACLMTGEFYMGMESKKNVDFYIIKGIVEEVLDFLGYENRYSFILPKETIKELHPGQMANINVNGEDIGIIGRVHPEIVKENVFVMEINLEKLLAKKTGKMKFKEISIYPEVKKDIAILIDKNITSDEIAKTIKVNAGKLLIKSEVFDVYEGNNLPSGKRSIAYSLTFGSNDRTLTDEEVNPIIDKIVTGLDKAYGAELRK
jgi:phenylalanyl-tRNA synthetase beta chain